MNFYNWWIFYRASNKNKKTLFWKKIIKKRTVLLLTNGNKIMFIQMKIVILIAI